MLIVFQKSYILSEILPQVENKIMNVVISTVISKIRETRGAQKEIHCGWYVDNFLMLHLIGKPERQHLIPNRTTFQCKPELWNFIETKRSRLFHSVENTYISRVARHSYHQWPKMHS